MDKFGVKADIILLWEITSSYYHTEIVWRIAAQIVYALTKKVCDTLIDSFKLYENLGINKFKI